MELLRKLTFWTSFSLLLFVFSVISYGQEEQIAISDKNLDSQFAELLKKSETYQEYKVIKISRLNDFWSGAQDSLLTLKTGVKSLNMQVGQLTGKVDDLQEKLSTTEENLAASEKQNGQMSFLGIRMKKGLYNVITWLVIGGLLAVIGIGYSMVKLRNRQAKDVKEELTNAQKELQNFRFKAQETQMKLKRELQTALNRLEVQ